MMFRNVEIQSWLESKGPIAHNFCAVEMIAVLIFHVSLYPMYLYQCALAPKVL